MRIAVALLMRWSNLFYKGSAEGTPVAAPPALDAEALASLLANNPELLKMALKSVQLANNA